MIKKLLFILVATSSLFVPIMVFAASSAFPFVSTWILPAPSSVYAFGADIHVTGTSELPPNWAGNIYVYLDGVQVGNTMGGQYVSVNNVGGIATSTSSFDFNIGPKPDGTHAIQLIFWGGEECAINTVVGAAFSPLCSVNEDNFVPNQVYPERTFVVGVPPYPRMVVTPDPDMVFASVSLGTMQDQLFTITNTGGQTLTGSISSLNDPFYCIPPFCSYSVNASTSLQVRIRFAPTTMGAQGQMVSFSCNGTSLPCSVPILVRSIKGSAVANPIAPKLWVNTNSLNFNPINFGFTVDRTLTISNHGGGILNGLMTFNSSEYSCVGPCNYSLFAGATTTLTIRFSPAVSGVHNNAATLSGGVGKIVTLQSNVNNLPLLSLSPTQWIISSPPPVNVGDYRTIGVRVRNVGAGLLSGAITSLPNKGFSCVANCSYSGLAATSSDWVVTLRFDPIDGSLATTTAIFTNLVNPANDQTFYLQGQGNTQPIASLSGGTTLYFGTVLVGQTKYAITTLTNTGVGVLSGTVSVPMGVFSCVFNCSFTVASGSSTQIVFAFSPAVTAHYVQNAQIGTKILRLDGYGAEPNFRMSFIVTPSSCGSFPQYCLPTSPKTYDIGTTTYGGSAAVQNKTFYLYIQHTGSGGVVNYNLPNTTHFVCTDALGCNGVLNVGGSRSVQYTFIPSASGDYTEDLNVDYDYNDGTTHAVTLKLKAHSISAPYLTVTPGGYTWPGLTNVGNTGTTVPPFVVGNVGTGTLSGVVVVAAPFYCVSGCIFSHLDNGDTQQVVFNFVPTGAGPALAPAIFSSNGGTITSLLRGTGNLAPIIEVTPPAYIGFSATNLGTYEDVPVVVKNIGLGVLNVSSSVFSSEIHFKCVQNCTPVIPSGSSTQMMLRFAPLTTGPLTDFLNISSNAANASVKTVQVGGEGIFAPIIDIRGGDTNFGDVIIGKFKEKTFTVKNLGTVDLGQGIFNLSGPFHCVAPINLLDGKCHYNLTAGSEIVVTIRFTPTVRGLASGVVSLSGVPLGKFFVTGNGIPPTVKFMEK